MEFAAEEHGPDRSQSTPDFVHIADVLKEIDLLVAAMQVQTEREAGDMHGPILPEQRDASRDLDLIAEIEGTE